MWWTQPTVDSAIEKLTNITDQLGTIAAEKHAEVISAREHMNRATVERDRAKRIHDKLNELLN